MEEDKAIQQFIASILAKIPDAIKQGKVVAGSIDRDNATCSVAVTGEDVYKKVRLRALITTPANTGIIVYPADNSGVLIGCIEQDTARWAVLYITEFSDALIAIEGKFKAELKADGTLLLNDGNNGGLVDIQPLVDAFNAQADFNTKLIAYIATLVSPSGAVSAPGPAPIPPTAPIRSALEDTKVKH